MFVKPRPIKGPDKSGDYTGGTKLVLRPDPPANDADHYGPNEPGKFMGYILGRISRPVWMTNEFYADSKDPVTQSNAAGDWATVLLYLPIAGEKPTAAEATLINSVGPLSLFTDSAIDRGCGGWGPVCILFAGLLDALGQVTLSPPSTESYYAVASAREPDNALAVTEWTIATQANRARFEASNMHRAATAVFRNHAVVKEPDRKFLFDKIRSLPDTFRP